MSRARALSVIVWMLLCAPSPGWSVTIDFGSTAAGDPLSASDEVAGTEWLSLGVLFTPASGFILDLGCGFLGYEGPDLCLGASTVGTEDFFGGDFGGILTITFPGFTGGSASSVLLQTFGNGTTVTIRDSSNAILLFEVADLPAGEDINFSNPDIHSIEIDFNFDAIETFTFVPEPSTGALVLLGLGVLAAVPRFRRHSRGLPTRSGDG